MSTEKMSVSIAEDRAKNRGLVSSGRQYSKTAQSHTAVKNKLAASTGDSSYYTGLVNRRDALISDAMGFLGVKYVWGGRSPKGFDCSGFTSFVYEMSGVKIPRTSRSQSKTGKMVTVDDLQPGDLLFFHTGASRAVNHVGIYIGSGQFIHSSSGRNAKKVVITELRNGFYDKKFHSAKRILLG
jgi:cell wall-associated NlpC family hydrolase